MAKVNKFHEHRFKNVLMRHKTASVAPLAQATASLYEARQSQSSVRLDTFKCGLAS